MPPQFELIQGERYEVIFRMPGQRKYRVLVGDYAGTADRYYVFDGGVEYNSARLPPEAIISVQWVRRGSRPISSPRRLKATL